MFRTNLVSLDFFWFATNEDINLRNTIGISCSEFSPNSVNHALWIICYLKVDGLILLQNFK